MKVFLLCFIDYTKAFNCVNHKLMWLCKVNQFVSCDIMMQLTSAFILSRLDYCYRILACLPESSILTLQHVQNAAVRLVLGLGPCDHMSDGLLQLHWLPFEARIRHKLCLLMHMVHTGRCPPYLRDILRPVSSSSGRSGFWAASTAQFVKPRLGTVLVNVLLHSLDLSHGMIFLVSSYLHNVTFTDLFERQLKIHFFGYALT
jgi:hypothetical protein